MKHTYIYIILIAIIFFLIGFAIKQDNKIRDLEVVLQQCSDRYYDVIEK